MKSALTVTLLLASTLALGCKKPEPNTETPEPTPVEPQPGETDDGKAVAPAGGEVAITPTDTEVTVELGATLTWSFKSHASVGIGADAAIADPSVLELVRTDTNYEQPGPDRPPGGDAATGVFVLETRAAGTTTVTFREMFRGEVEREQVVTVTVVAK
jgi:hypothetical protein